MKLLGRTWAAAKARPGIGGMRKSVIKEAVENEKKIASLDHKLLTICIDWWQKKCHVISVIARTATSTRSQAHTPAYCGRVMALPPCPLLGRLGLDVIDELKYALTPTECRCSVRVMGLNIKERNHAKGKFPLANCIRLGTNQFSHTLPFHILPHLLGMTDGCGDPTVLCRIMRDPRRLIPAFIACSPLSTSE